MQTMTPAQNDPGNRFYAVHLLPFSGSAPPKVSVEKNRQIVKNNKNHEQKRYIERYIERKRERESVCVCKIERESVCVCVCD